MKRLLLPIALLLIAADTQPASQPAAYDTPLAACQAYCEKSIEANADGVLALGIVTDPKFKEACAIVEKDSASRARLEQAIAAKFPGGDAEVIPGGRTMDKIMHSILARLPKAKIEVAPDNKTATVTYPPDENAPGDAPPAEPFYCIRDATGWKIDLIRADDADASTLAMLPLLKSSIEQNDQFTAEIKQGKYATLAEIKTHFNSLEAATTAP